uniref:Ig-like domain-containing protein n=1 Tax=Cyclopterus lumpus TaxID=8103 RepID=A0A8C2Z9L2_CYCLU
MHFDTYSFWFDFEPIGQSWNISVPRYIPTTLGSNVTIGCTFTVPPKSRTESVQVYWKKPERSKFNTFDKDPNAYVFHPNDTFVLEKYRGKTKLIGNKNLAARNCSMLLDGVRNTDVGPFYFRIEMPHYTSYSYTMNPVHIDVLRKPTPPSLSAEVKAKVTAYCSVTHPCPTNAPEFSWSQSGTASRRSKKLNTWQWKTISTLTFRLRPTTSNQTLNCTVRYRGGKQATSLFPYDLLCFIKIKYQIN